VKSYYRKTKALIKKDKLDEALATAQQALQLDATSSEVKKMIMQIE